MEGGASFPVSFNDSITLLFRPRAIALGYVILLKRNPYMRLSRCYLKSESYYLSEAQILRTGRVPYSEWTNGEEQLTIQNQSSRDSN